MRLTAPKCVLACMCAHRSDGWMNQPSVCENTPSGLPLSFCCSTHTNCMAVQTYTYTQSRIPRTVPMPELAPLSMPGEHASKQQSLRKLCCADKDMAANILRENNLNMSWKQKEHHRCIPPTHKYTHTQTHTRARPTSFLNSQVGFWIILNFTSDFFFKWVINRDYKLDFSLYFFSFCIFVK